MCTRNSSSDSTQDTWTIIFTSNFSLSDYTKDVHVLYVNHELMQVCDAHFILVHVTFYFDDLFCLLFLSLLAIIWSIHLNTAILVREKQWTLT